jgi:hypothetical protein
MEDIIKGLALAIDKNLLTMKEAQMFTAAFFEKSLKSCLCVCHEEYGDDLDVEELNNGN